MEEALPKQPNKIITYIKTNKYNVYFTVAIALLLFMIIGMIALVAGRSTKPSTQVTNTQPTAAVSNTVSSPAVSQSPSPETILAITPEPTIASQIETQTQPQISPNVAVPYTVAKINQYGSDWAIMEITNPDTDPANVVVKKENGSWKVLLGPGTHFDDADLQQIGAPQELINDANSNL
jgi:hypothetical protein